MSKLTTLLTCTMMFAALSLMAGEDGIPDFYKNAFRVVDKNADGLLTPDEVKTAAGDLNVPLERFRLADENNDHRLSLHECFAAKLWPPKEGKHVVGPVGVVPRKGKVVVPGGPNSAIARDIREDVRDRREDIADRREDIADRREDIADRREDIIDAQHDGGLADRLEDIRDRQEDIRDRQEDIRDRAEDVRDRREDVRDRNHGVPPPSNHAPRHR